MPNPSKLNHDRPSGTPIIPEDNHIPRTERNSVQSQSLPELGRKELLLAGQDVLGETNPPREEVPYFRKVVDEQLFDYGTLRYEPGSLAGRLQTCRRLEAESALQAQGGAA